VAGARGGVARGTVSRATLGVARPGWIPPMLATLVATPFSRQGWLFETKLDGVRCLALRDGRRVELLSRNRLSLSAKYPEIAEALQRNQRAGDGGLMLDGEIVAFEGAVT